MFLLAAAAAVTSATLFLRRRDGDKLGVEENEDGDGDGDEEELLGLLASSSTLREELEKEEG